MLGSDGTLESERCVLVPLMAMEHVYVRQGRLDLHIIPHGSYTVLWILYIPLLVTLADTKG